MVLSTNYKLGVCAWVIGQVFYFYPRFFGLVSTCAIARGGEGL